MLMVETAGGANDLVMIVYSFGLILYPPSLYKYPFIFHIKLPAEWSINTALLSGQSITLFRTLYLSAIPRRVQ